MKYFIETMGKSESFLESNIVIGIVIHEIQTDGKSKMITEFGRHIGIGNSFAACVIALHQALIGFRRYLRSVPETQDTTLQIMSSNSIVIELVGKHYDSQVSYDIRNLRTKIMRLITIIEKKGVKISFVQNNCPRACSQADKILHELSIHAGYTQREKKELIDMIKKDRAVLPLSIFRQKKYENLTIAEALVYELIDKRNMNIAEVSRELNREYNTIRTQYERAKGKI